MELLKLQRFFCGSVYKAFPDGNLNVAQMRNLFFMGVENIGRNGENAGHQHFSFFHYDF